MSRKPSIDRASLAFDVHSALLRIEAEYPDLKDNPFWIMLKQDAYERFHIAFETAK